MKTQRKTYLNCLILFMIGLVVIGGWIFGNVAAITADDPEVAAKEAVTAMYSAAIFEHKEIQIIPLEYGSSVPAGPIIRFVATADGDEIGEIEVRSFLGIGWQLGSYRRTGQQNKPEAGNGG